jgi:hypothetical protein
MWQGSIWIYIADYVIGRFEFIYFIYVIIYIIFYIPYYIYFI